MTLTVVSPACIVNCSAEHKGFQLQRFLVDFHSGPVLSGVMGLISELKSGRHTASL